MDTFCGSRTGASSLILGAFLVAGAVCLSQQPMELANMPRFLSTNTNFTYKVGQVAILECAIENLEDKKQVVWRLASDTVPISVGYFSFSEDPRYAVEHDHGGTKWNLIIRNVQVRDSGVYECQVSSRMRHLRHHVTLMVVDPHSTATTPKPNIQISGSNFVDEGDRVYLMCNASSQEYPAEDIDWFRDGIALTTDESGGVQIHKYVSLSTATIVSTLEIKQARMVDQGIYVCRTSNKDVTSTYLNVLNADTFNVKRDDLLLLAGTAKKDSTMAARGSLGEQQSNSGSKWGWRTSGLLVVSLVSVLLSARAGSGQGWT